MHGSKREQRVIDAFVGEHHHGPLDGQFSL